MPRQSRSSGSSGFGSRSRSNSYSSSRPSSNTSSNYSRPQQPVQQTQSAMPMQQPQGGSMLGGIGSTIVQGMAFGGGSEIGHQAVRALMGGGSSHHGHEQRQPVESQQNNNQNNQNQQQQRNTPCTEYNVRFIDCLKQNDNNISTCQAFFDDLKSCEKSLI